MFYPVEKSLTCSLQSVQKSMGASLSVTKDIHAEVLVSIIWPKLSLKCLVELEINTQVDQTPNIIGIEVYWALQ